MTERMNGFWVALGDDIRIDDAEATLAAVRQIKGVIAVNPNVTNGGDWIVEERANAAWRAKLYELLK